MGNTETTKATFSKKCEDVGKAMLGDSFDGVYFPNEQQIVELRSKDSGKTVAMNYGVLECMWKALKYGDGINELEIRTVCNWFLESDGDLAKTLYGLVRPKMFPFEKKDY